MVYMYGTAAHEARPTMCYILLIIYDSSLVPNCRGISVDVHALPGKEETVLFLIAKHLKHFCALLHLVQANLS